MTEVPRWPNRHVLREDDVHKFISILPDWEKLSRGLEEVILANRDDEDVDGWYALGTVAVCAWPDGLTDTWPAAHYEEHRKLLERLGVPCEPEYLHVCHLSNAHVPELDARQPKNLLRHFPVDYGEDLTVEILKPSSEWALKDEDDVTVYSIVSAPKGVDVYDVYYKCRFQEGTVRAYQLLHIFLHELGHHHDNMTIPFKGWVVRGESFAEDYACKYERQIWDKYFEIFKP